MDCFFLEPFKLEQVHAITNAINYTCPELREDRRIEYDSPTKKRNNTGPFELSPGKSEHGIVI